MFYKWGGSDILSISTFNHYSRILKVVAVILLQKKYGIIWELFPKGGGSPIPKTLSKFTNMVFFYICYNPRGGVRTVFIWTISHHIVPSHGSYDPSRIEYDR